MKGGVEPAQHHVALTCVGVLDKHRSGQFARARQQLVIGVDLMANRVLGRNLLGAQHLLDLVPDRAAIFEITDSVRCSPAARRRRSFSAINSGRSRGRKISYCSNGRISLSVTAFIAWFLSGSRGAPSTIRSFINQMIIIVIQRRALRSRIEPAVGFGTNAVQDASIRLAS